MSRGFQFIYCDQERRYTCPYIWNIYIKHKINLSGRRILSWFFRINISSVQQYRWQCTSLEWIRHWSQARQRPLLLLRNRLTESKHLRNSLYSICLSLMLRTKLTRHLNATFNESKPLSQLRNCHGPLLTIRVRFLNFLIFKGRFPNFTDVVQCEILSWQLRKSMKSSALHLWNLRVSLIIMGLQANDVNCGTM